MLCSGYAPSRLAAAVGVEVGTVKEQGCDREAAEISVRTLARPRSSSESGLPLPEEARRYDLSL